MLGERNLHQQCGIGERVLLIVGELRLVAGDRKIGVRVQAGGVGQHSHVGAERFALLPSEVAPNQERELAVNPVVPAVHTGHGEDLALEVFAFPLGFALDLEVFLGSDRHCSYYLTADSRAM